MALVVVVICNIWGKGMVKILPILIGVLVSYAVALVTLQYRTLTRTEEKM